MLGLPETPENWQEQETYYSKFITSGTYLLVSIYVIMWAISRLLMYKSIFLMGWLLRNLNSKCSCHMENKLCTNKQTQASWLAEKIQSAELQLA